MRYDEPDVREAYRQGARDAFESVASTLNRSEARSVKAWLDALEGWEDGDPPNPPLPPQA